MRDWLPVPLLAAEIDADAKTARHVVSPAFDGRLNTLRDMEAMLQERFDDWMIEVIPPAATLPDVNFSKGKAVLSDEATAELDTIVWTHKRWRMHSAQVNGFASRSEAGKPQNTSPPCVPKQWVNISRTTVLRHR